MTQVAQQPAAAPVQQNTVPALVQPTPSERFTAAIEKEFSSNAGELNLTSFQRKLCQNYFIKIDTNLKALEIKRLQKSEQYRDPTPFTWEYVNLPKLANDVISFSSVGLDPAQPNHINIIPYKNNALGKYDMTFIIGYKGSEIKAKKYGLEIPDDIIVELVYANDKFKQFKKDINNRVETYSFEIIEDFNRGEIVGGFYYHRFFNQPEKNKIRVFSKADIDKRRPEHGSPEFWGGEKDEYVGGKKTGKKVEVEGWYDEMAYKTIYRAAYNSITIDSEKIDQNYLNVIKRENDRIPNEIAKEIKENANNSDSSIGFEENMPITPSVVVTEPTAVQKEQPKVETIEISESNPESKSSKASQLKFPD